MDANVALALSGYGLAFVVATAFVVYLLRSGHLGPLREPLAAAFLFAVSATAVWGLGSAAAIAWGGSFLGVAAIILDKLREAGWLTFLLLLAPPSWIRSTSGPARWTLPTVAVVWTASLAARIAAPDSQALWNLAAAGGLATSVIGLVLVEQLLRNQSDDMRWNAKPVCLALGFDFAFEVYLYTEALMFGRFDVEAISLRGLVYAATMPLLFVASRRHAGWIGKLKVSPTAAFYSASLLLVGAYLLFIAAVGYYVRYFGGEWGRALQLALLLVAALVLAVLLLSGALRARLRVFLSKNFFNYRYDYRQEWLRVTAMLSGTSAPQEVGVLVIRALADVVECPAGALWTRDREGGHLVQAVRWNSAPTNEREPVDSPFCKFLREHQWIVDFDEFRAQPRRYGDLTLPLWLITSPTTWLLIPLLVEDDLTGFVVLSRPRTPVETNWEVRDLLKIAARQAAGVLARMQATEALLEARKFDAFNRMSAFVVHDLKNIVAQLSLMLKNARRHGHNPEFQQDMLLTVESSLEKMRQMMLQLREGAKPVGATSGVELGAMLQRLVQVARTHGRHIELHIVDAVSTRGDEQRLERVLGHLVQNALDATLPTGRVWVQLQQSSGRVVLVVGDTGRGMTQDFIQTRLFRPFNSTKEGGMGIGAYESFQYIKELGGSIDVRSEPERGSEVTVTLPLLDARRAADLQMTSQQ